jgi:hypothetical protein
VSRMRCTASCWLSCCLSCCLSCKTSAEVCFCFPSASAPTGITSYVSRMKGMASCCLSCCLAARCSPSVCLRWSSRSSDTLGLSTLTPTGALDVVCNSD